MDMKDRKETFYFKLSKEEAKALRACLGKQSVSERKRWGVLEEHALTMRRLHNELDDRLKEKKG